MKTTDVQTNLINGYFKLLRNLSPASKLDLIEKLTKSLRLDLTSKRKSLKQTFGAFQSDQSANELIREIRESRNFTRNIEEI